LPLGQKNATDQQCTRWPGYYRTQWSPAATKETNIRVARHVLKARQQYTPFLFYNQDCTSLQLACNSEFHKNWHTFPINHYLIRELLSNLLGFEVEKILVQPTLLKNLLQTQKKIIDYVQWCASDSNTVSFTNPQLKVLQNHNILYRVVHKDITLLEFT